LSGEARALITGASSGIGEAFARALKARGHRLVLVARRRERLEALAAQLGEDPTSVLVSDLARPGAAEAILAEVTRRRFEVDLLVNNAGVGHTARFHEQPNDRIASMLDVNVRAVVEMTRAFLPAMVERGRGQILNVASNAAFQPVPYLAIYAATKAFVLSFSEGLSTELEGTGVTVQALCPGLTRTEFLEVSETHTQGLLVGRMPAMTAAQVVSVSLKALDRGRVRVVPGLPNRALAAAQALVPRAWVRRVAAALYRPHGGGPPA
jgi:short-subunit dehydrogenase